MGGNTRLKIRLKQMIGKIKKEKLRNYSRIELAHNFLIY